MTQKRDITILVTTWLPPGRERERLDAFEAAVESWHRNLQYDGDLVLLVVDDGTTPEWWERLQKAIAFAWSFISPPAGPPGFLWHDRGGLGRSLNAGLQQAWLRSPIVLHTPDDWILNYEFDITPWVNFLEDLKFDAGMVRFFPHPDLGGVIRFVPPHGWAMALERHHFVFGLRPCLWHQRFFQALGLFREGVSAVECEQDFNYRLTSRPATVEGERIWLALPSPWEHLDPMTLSDVVPSVPGTPM